jgi:hypothetical protein
MNWYQRNSRDVGEIMWAVSTVIGAVFLVAAIACIAVSITGGSLRATAGDKCAALGYPEVLQTRRGMYCIRKVNGTDDVRPLP